ncbi:CapA family protein [Mesorhizobium sp. M0514]|uniref:CapA family protein n=1 Tax=Mesorhizobium sp. M0514 TaxID=2956955 RepID=UPI00333C0425
MTSPFTAAMTGQSLIHHDVPASPDSGFHGIVQMLKTADVVFTNLETTVRGRRPCWPIKGPFFGCSDPFVLDVLKDTGFSTLSLANNHAFDLGPGGVLSTLEDVEARGFLDGTSVTVPPR